MLPGAMHKGLRYIKDRQYRFAVNSAHGLYKHMPDELYLKKLYKSQLGQELNLDNPQTFNEKLQWLKLHDRNPMYTVMVDKYAVKKWVADRIGEEYVIPLLGVWEHFDDIDFNALPDQFVLKCTHDSGGLVIVKDKAAMDKKAAKKKLERCLKRNYYWIGREWPYKDVPPRIIAEKYMVDESGTELKDYKIYNFDGEPKIIHVDYDRFVEHKRNLYTTDWKYIEAAIQYPTDPNRTVDRPCQLEKMLELAHTLSAGIPHVRSDFYCIDGQVYFGELTFFHESGFGKFTPEHLGEEMGNWLKLPGGGYILTNDFAVFVLREKTPAAHEELKDYKFMCFNGHVKCIFTVTERFSGDGLKVTFFDRDWNPLPFERHYPKSTTPIPKPYHFEKMTELAEKLSEDIPFVRVDFYESGGQIYFGEMTFYPGDGVEEFSPEQWDKTLGDWIDLPISEWGGYTVIDGITVFIQYVRKSKETDLKDYKFYCFNGTPQFCQVISDRSTRETIDFFDMNWNHQKFTGLALPHHHHPFSDCPIAKPVTFEKMKSSATVLSTNMSFLRVDFYEVNRKMFFGELTFYPASGFGEFEPEYYNRALGNMMILPKKG